MTARTFAQWIALGSPVTVRPDGRKAYLLNPAATFIHLKAGMAVVSDQPYGSSNAIMPEHKITPIPIDLVELDLSLIPA